MNDLRQTSAHREDALSRSLKKLPDHPAPPTLAPRVLAAVQQRRGLLGAWRRASSRQQAVILMALSPALLLPVAYLAATFVPREWVAGVGALDTVADAVGTACSAFCDNCINIALAVSATLFVTLYLTCLGLGTAAYQLVRRH